MEVVTINQCGELIEYVWIDNALLRLDELQALRCQTTTAVATERQLVRFVWTVVDLRKGVRDEDRWIYTEGRAIASEFFGEAHRRVQVAVLQL